MAKSKKYDFSVLQQDSSWAVAIIRQVTSTKTVITKSQDGFASEAEAQAWGETELTSFLHQLTERNRRRTAKR